MASEYQMYLSGFFPLPSFIMKKWNKTLLCQCHIKIDFTSKSRRKYLITAWVGKKIETWRIRTNFTVIHVFCYFETCLRLIMCSNNRDCHIRPCKAAGWQVHNIWLQGFNEKSSQPVSCTFSFFLVTLQLGTDWMNEDDQWAV